MRILLTHRSTIDRIGGVSTFIFEVSEALIAAGHEAAVLDYSHQRDREWIKEHYFVEYVPKIYSLKEWSNKDYWPPRGSSPRDQVIWMIRGSRFIKWFEPDIVLINGIIPLIKRRRTRYIAYAHTICPHVCRARHSKVLGKVFLKLLYQYTPDKIYAATRREKHCLTKYIGLNRDTIEVIPPCINIDKLYRPSRNKENIIMHIGTSYLKNLELTMKIFDRICGSIDVELHIAGYHGVEHEEMKNRLIDKECHDKIVFLGTLPRQKLIDALAKARLLLVPSRYESFNYASIEAMALGTPIIASYMVPPNVVLDGITGYRINSLDDPAPYIEKIRLLLTNDELWRDFSRNAIEHAKTFDCRRLILPKLISELYMVGKNEH